MAGASVSETQLTSSRKRMPSRTPDSAMESYAAAMISLMV